MASLRQIRSRGPGLAIYAACLALVVSFILFEVLDVDGSDFPARGTTPSTAIRLADPPHDLKRAHLPPPAEGWTDGCRLPACILERSVRPLAAAAPAPTGAPHAHAYRPTLARGSLADPLPSA